MLFKMLLEITILCLNKPDSVWVCCHAYIPVLRYVSLQEGVYMYVIYRLTLQLLDDLQGAEELLPKNYIGTSLAAPDIACQSMENKRFDAFRLIWL